MTRPLSRVPAVDRMPRPGDPYANAFVAEHMKCWRMVHDRQGQADHCLETPSWTGTLVLAQWRPLVACVGLLRAPGRADGPRGVWRPAVDALDHCANATASTALGGPTTIRVRSDVWVWATVSSKENQVP